MPGPVYELLQQDHARLDELLRRVDGSPGALDLEAYESFRAGLLRHIAMEEKVLVPEARRLGGGQALDVARQLREDHAALASLLVPTPSREIIECIRNVLIEHNPLEEGSGGFYELCEQLPGVDLEALLARLRATPEVPLARHFDGPRAREHIENLLRARAARK